MNVIDSAIGFVSPAWAARRLQARATLKQIQSFVGGKQGYNAGILNRLTKGRVAAQTKEHALPHDQFQMLVSQSWDLFRNNSYARKIVRSLESKVIGQGLMPESLAVRTDDSPHVEFRKRALKLWQQIQCGFDLRGMPGKGGQTFAGLQRLALRSTILSGESLYRLAMLQPADQIARDVPVPLALQLIDASRLAENTDVPSSEIPDGHQLYRGIQLDVAGLRVAYWINSVRPGDSHPAFRTAKKRSASEIGHLFVEEDIDQYRGTPWFAPAILQMRDTGDLQYNVLKASAMAACIVLGYRKPTGVNRFGLNQQTETVSGSADGTDLTDEDGNAITKIQPGMFVNLGKDGELQGFTPQQPHLNAEMFIQHMLRGTAAGFPGVKSSTVTGDYRNSSFSSERSADNDIWPEVHAVQDWFASSFCQPIYEAVIRAAVLSGYFDGVLSASEFAANPSRYLAAKWQGPVAQSINPVDDVKAASGRVKHGLSSFQMECAKVNVSWIDVLNDIAELYQTAESKQLPPEVINNILGIGPEDVTAQVAVQQADSESADKTEDVEEPVNA
jgi:lambda family phage portal protein